MGSKIINQLHKFRGCSVRQRTFFVLFAAFLVLAASGVAWSQTVQGVITGTITDPTGAVVPGATVTITNVGTNISQTTTTGSDGFYRFPLVPPGTYTLEVKAANFGGVRVSGVVVEASQTIAINRQLELAKTSQLVEVTAEIPLVQTATSDLGFQVDAKTIENAALVDRDVFGALPFMAPQVSPGLDMSPTSGGARESGTSYLLNGADDNNNFSEGAIGTSPPLESVEDFTIVTNSMSAQYGRGAGAVVTANQKSGTNMLHGALYEQNRNASLNSNDFFYNRDLGNDPTLPKKPKYIKNQFGGAVGGPIRKDKTFFFVAVDRYKLLQGFTAANNFEPTSAALAFVKARGGPLAQQILAAYPPATSDLACPGNPQWTDSNGNALGPQTGAGTNPFNGLPNAAGCLSFSDPVTTSQNVYYGRVDHNFSASDRLSFTANITRFSQLDKYGNFIGVGGSILANGGNIPGSIIVNAHNLALIETHTFNSRLFNEVNLSHNRFFNPLTEGDPAKQTAPQVTIDNQSAGCFAYSFGPFEGEQIESFVEDRWGLQDNMTWTVGHHAFKFGGGATYGVLYRNWDLGLPGNYEFGDLTNVTGDCRTSCSIITPTSDGTRQSDGTIANVTDETHANFSGDYPYFMETSIDPRSGAKANAYRHYTAHDYAVFAVDDWKVTPRLTLNLGLRWERFGAPSEDHGVLAQFTNISSCNVTTDFNCIANAQTNPVSRMWKTRNGDFGPRIGFAWDPQGKGKMAVRGGYGIYYDRIFDNIWSNGAWNPPFYALADFENDTGDAIFYSNPASIGPAYNPSIPGCQIPNAANANCIGHRVSVRTMDVNMHDSSGQNYYLGLERQFFGGLLLSAKYQGSMGRHLPMLENYNRLDGDGYYNFAVGPTTIRGNQSPTRPNPLYTGFNYRSNSVSSNYNSLVLEAQKHMGHGLQFQTGYTFSKLLDVNSELFAGCSNIGGRTAPYYYISNSLPKLSYGRAAFDHRHSVKFNFTYDLPFLRQEKGFVGHVLGGWTLSSFFQMYAGHPIDVYNGRAHLSAKTLIPGGGIEPNGSICAPTPPATSCSVFLLDQNGARINVGGDYNLDGVLNDHPVFIGSSLSSVYSGKSPADGIFTDNNKIGCGEAGTPSTVNFGATSSQCVGFSPNSLFANPAYPTGTTPYMRFGTLGRNIFVGPRFVAMDMGLKKTFKLSERMNLRFSADAQNLFNHPNFDGVDANLSSGTFGQAQLLEGTQSRVMSLSLRLAF